MSIFSSAMGWELSLQSRSFIYPATVVSTLMICGFILVLPVEALEVKWATFFIFMDPAMIGLSFVGAIILMEKSEGTISALGVTPMKPSLYIAAKVFSLTLVTFASGLVVAFVAADGFSIGRMLGVLTLSSTVAVLFGFVCAAKSSTMNQLTITLLWVSMIAYLPLLTYFEVLPQFLKPLVALIPSYSVLYLLDACLDGSSLTELWTLVAYGYLFAWVAIGWAWASRVYMANIVTEGK